MCACMTEHRWALFDLNKGSETNICNDEDLFTESLTEFTGIKQEAITKVPWLFNEQHWVM